MANQDVILYSAFNPEQLNFPPDVLINARGGCVNVGSCQQQQKM